MRSLRSWRSSELPIYSARVWNSRNPGVDCASSRTSDGNSDEVFTGANGYIFQNIASFACEFLCHYHNACQYATRNVIGALVTNPNSWVLLDTCSTFDVSNNPELVVKSRDYDSDNF